MKKLVSLCLFIIASASILATTGCYWGRGGGYIVVGSPSNNASSSIYVLQNNTSATTPTPPQVLQFRANATGTPAPSNTLNFAATATATAIAIATDVYGDVYVADSIDLREYAPNAFNNYKNSSTNTTSSPTPIMLIPADATTTVGAITGLTVDTYGNIYAAEASGGIAIFNNRANGDVAPNRYILGASQTGGGLSTLVSPTSLATDNYGNLYVLDANQVTAGQSTIDVFAPGATGNVAPTATLTGTNIGSVTSIATDSANNLYTTSNLNGASISIYPPGSTGNATAKWTIDGASTGLGALYDIAVDQNANIYVVTDGASGSTVLAANPTILKFSNFANGNVAPLSSFTPTAWSSTNPLMLAVSGY